MGNMVLDFLGGLAQSVASPFEYLAKTDIINPINELRAQFSGNPQQQQQAISQSNEDLGLGASGTNIGQGLRTFAGNAAQVGLDVAAPGIAKGAEGAVGLAGKTAETLGGKMALGAAKGAVAGAAVGGPFGVAQGVASQQPANAQNLTLDFLSGAGAGAALGGTLGGGLAGILSDHTAAAVAKSDNPQAIAKQLEPEVGPVVAQDTAPALAKTNDPNVVQNVVKNDIQSKLPPLPQGYQYDEYGRGDQFITDYENARNAGDTATMQRIAREHPDDQRVQPGPPKQDAPFLNTPGEEAQGASHISQTTVDPVEVKKYADTFGISEEEARNDLAAPARSNLKLARQPAYELSLALQSGESLEQVANQYIERTGASLEQTQKAIKDIMGQKNFPKGNVNSKLNPHFEEAKTLIPKASNNDEINSNTRAVQNVVYRNAETQIKEMDKLSPEALDKVFDLAGHTVEDVLPTVPEAERAQFTKVAQLMKDGNDWNQAIGSGMLGERTPYRTNYGLPLLAAPKEGEPTLSGPSIGTAGKKVNPLYSLPRNVEDYAALKKAGYTPLFDDPRDVVAFDAARRANNFTDLALRKGFSEAYPDQLITNRIGTYKGQPFGQIKYNGRTTGISVPQAAAEAFNARQESLQQGALGEGYDRLNSQWKNLKLAGGGFHSINVTGTYAGQQVSSLLTGGVSPARAVSDFNTLMKSTLSKEAFDQKVAELQGKGNNRLIDFDVSGLTTKTTDVQADVKGEGITQKIPLLKQIHDAIFGRQIPMMKMLIADQKFDQLGLDRSNPEDLKQMMAISKELNQNFGGLNRAIQGFSPRTYQTLAKVFLATDYNEGQIRSLVDALDPRNINTAEGRLAKEVVFGKAFLFAATATGLGAIGGEFKGQDPKQIALEIMQKTVNPKFQFGSYTVGLPTTQLSELGKPASEAIGNAVQGKNVLTPIQDFASARLAAVPSAGEQLATNRNFSGQAIYGQDYYGRPISPLQTAANLAGMASPIPVSQGIKTATGQQDIGAALANIAGLNVRPTYDLQYAPIAGQTYVQALQDAGAPKEQIQADTQFFSLLGTLSKAKKSALNNAISDIGKKDVAGAEQEISSYNAEIAQALQPWVQSGGGKYFDSTMLQLLHAQMITLSSANRSARTDIKNNPTAYGLPLSASVLASQAQQNVANTSQVSNNP